MRHTPRHQNLSVIWLTKGARATSFPDQLDQARKHRWYWVEWLVSVGLLE